jgi:DNA-directed RNA polymerase subunit RPC12/RpoP
MEIDESGGIDKIGCSGIAAIIGTKECATDGKRYEAKEAERRDLAYIVENTCMRCGRQFKKGETRIEPPETTKQKDPYIIGGLVARRYICMKCYEEMGSKEREKTREEYRKEVNNEFIRSLLEGMLKPKVKV